MKLYLDMMDVTFADLKVVIMHYYQDHGKNLRTPEPPMMHALVVHDLADVFETALVAPRQSLLLCPFCRDVVSYHPF